jgi:hypothetical protein
MDWIEVPIPRSLAPGPTAQVLHFLEVDEAWSVYIMEIDTEDEEAAAFVGPMGNPIQGRAKWYIIFNGAEVATGVLKNIKTAKNVSMTVLNSLMEGPEPETVNDLTGVVIGKGSGN